MNKPTTLIIPGQGEITIQKAIHNKNVFVRIYSGAALISFTLTIEEFENLCKQLGATECTK